MNKTQDTAILAKDVVKHLKRWDGTGGPDFVAELADLIKEEHQWVLREVSLADLDLGEDRNIHVLREYAKMSSARRPAIIALRDGTVIDGGHRGQAALMKGESTILAYVPAGYGESARRNPTQRNTAPKTDVKALLRQGIPVPDVFARSNDAECILDCEDGDLHWVEVQIPMDSFGFQDPIKERTGVPGGDPEQEAQRYQDVRDWMQAVGGPRKAIYESPILALFEQGHLQLLDGWHRMVVARELGVTDVTVLVGGAPKARRNPSRSVWVRKDMLFREDGRTTNITLGTRVMFNKLVHSEKGSRFVYSYGVVVESGTHNAEAKRAVGTTAAMRVALD